MSLTKKRKQLIAASLAAMTAFGATVPAIVASAPAAFAAEAATTATTGLSGAGITADAAPNTYNVSNVRIVPNSTDFEEGKNVDSSANEDDFSERTVSFNLDTIQDDQSYVLVQKNGAMYNWYTTSWAGSVSASDDTKQVVKGTSADDAEKQKVHTGAALKAGLTVLVQEGQNITFSIYSYDGSSIATSVGGAALATYTLNAPDAFAYTAFAEAPTVEKTAAANTSTDWKNQGKIADPTVQDNGDGTYNVNINVNEALESYDSSNLIQGNHAWVGVVIGNFKQKSTDASALEVGNLYYFSDASNLKNGQQLTAGEDAAVGADNTEFALYMKGDDVDTAGTSTRKIAVSTAQNPGVADQVAVLNTTLTRNYTPSEPATKTEVKLPTTSTGNLTMEEGTEPNTYTLSGTVFGNELDSSGDMFGEPNGTDKNKDNYAEVIVSIPMPTDFTEGDLELYSKSLPAYYSKENLQGATDNTDADLTNYGAYHRVTTATKDSGIFTTEGMSLLLHKEEDGTVGNFKIVVGGQTYTFDCSGVTFGTEQSVVPTLPADAVAGGTVTVESATLTAKTGATTVEIPDSINTYLTAGNSIPVEGGTATTVAPTAFTLNVKAGSAASIQLPDSVVEAAKTGKIPLTINIQNDAGEPLYTWKYDPTKDTTGTAQQTPANAMATAEKKMADAANQIVTYADPQTSASVELGVTVSQVGDTATVKFNQPIEANSGWTWTWEAPETGYRAYSDSACTKHVTTGVSISGKTVTVTDEVFASLTDNTLYLQKAGGSGSTGGGSTIPGGGGGGTTDPGEESNVKLDTQIVYMINEVSLYDFLVEGNNDTDNITVTSSNEAVATVALQDGADTRGAKYRVTTHGTGEATITVTYNGESATMDVVVYPKGGSITLDTVNYRMAPGNIYDIGVTVTDGAGNALSGEQVQQMYQNGTLRVTDSRTGSIVDLTQLPNGNFRVTGKNAGTCWITYEVIQDGVAVTHASVKVDVAAGVTQGGVATRDTSWWADKSADTTTQA